MPFETVPKKRRKSPKWGPECSRDPPGRVSKWLPEALWHSNWHVWFFEAIKVRTMIVIFSPFSSFLGPGRDKKIDQNRPCGQKGVPKDGAKSDFYAFAVIFRFFLPFEAKIRPKINEKLNVFFRCCVCFFQTRESQILCTGAVFWAVFTFSIFAIFYKK